MNLAASILVSLMILVYFIFGVFATLYWFQTPHGRIKDAETKLKIVWYFGAFFFGFIVLGSLGGLWVFLGLKIIGG